MQGDGGAMIALALLAFWWGYCFVENSDRHVRIAFFRFGISLMLNAKHYWFPPTWVSEETAFRIGPLCFDLPSAPFSQVCAPAFFWLAYSGERWGWDVQLPPAWQSKRPGHWQLGPFQLHDARHVWDGTPNEGK